MPSVNRFAPLQSSYIRNSGTSPSGASSLRQVGQAASQDSSPIQDVRRLFCPQKRKRRRRRHRVVGGRGVSFAHNSSPSSLSKPSSRIGVDFEASLDNSNPPINSGRTLGMWNAAEKTQSWLKPDEEPRDFISCMTPKVNPLPTTEPHDSPTTNCSILPTIKTEIQVLAPRYFDATRSIPLRAHTQSNSFASMPDDRSFIPDLEDAFQSVPFENCFKTPLPSTADHGSRFFASGKPLFGCLERPNKLRRTYRDALLHSDQPAAPPVVSSCPPDRSGPPQQQTVSLWDLRPEENQILQQWRIDWHMGRAHESGEEVAQGWIEDERFWEDLHNNIDPRNGISQLYTNSYRVLSMVDPMTSEGPSDWIFV